MLHRGGIFIGDIMLHAAMRQLILHDTQLRATRFPHARPGLTLPALAEKLTDQIVAPV
jgi:hypothetical protein